MDQYKNERGFEIIATDLGIPTLALRAISSAPGMGRIGGALLTHSLTHYSRVCKNSMRFFSKKRDPFRGSGEKESGDRPSPRGGFPHDFLPAGTHGTQNGRVGRRGRISPAHSLLPSHHARSGSSTGTLDG